MSEKLNIRIDGKELLVKPGTTVLEAASELGVVIPTMCHYQGLEHHTSCMMCMVKDRKNGSLFASCSMPATHGMDIISMDEEVRQSRKMALELLLSEHVGDCQAPCQLACPAHMDIPLMNRLLAEGSFQEAYEIVMKDIPLPGVLGRICPAPCEKACKRKDIDEPVNICLLKRFAGDQGVQKSKSRKVEESGKMVAVVGSGPAGLTAAYYARLYGYQVTIFEKESLAGGNLRHPEVADRLPAAVLDKEIDIILATGIKLETGRELTKTDLQQLATQYDAIILATSTDWEVETPTVIPAKAGTQMAIQAVAKGKEAALKAHQYLQGLEPTGEARRFNSRVGKLTPADQEAYLAESTSDQRYEPESLADGFTREKVIAEAARCMHCDCRKQNNCKLRDYADEYEAGQRRFSYGERKPVTKNIQKELVVYEPGKCIKCGICVRLTRLHQEKYGFTFIGRGFDVEVKIPFNESLGLGLAQTAQTVADACPTGAISWLGGMHDDLGPGQGPAPSEADMEHRKGPAPAPARDEGTHDSPSISRKGPAPAPARDEGTHHGTSGRGGARPLPGIATIILWMVMMVNTITAQNWPIFRGNQQLLGVSTEIFTSNPKLLWSLKPSDGIKAAPVVSDGIMVVADDNGVVFAFDEAGKKLWDFNTENAIEAPALLLDGKVFIGNLYGDVFALDLKTGKQLWKYQTENQISGSVNYYRANGKLYLLVGSYDYYLHCIDGASGKGLWKYESDNFINGAAGIFDGKAIFGGCDGFLHSIDVLTGKPVNKVQVATYVASSVAVMDNEAYLGDYDGRVSCVDLTDGKIAWKYEGNEEAQPFIGSPSVTKDRVVIGSRDKQVYCFNRVDGQLRWKTNSGSRVDASPVVVGNQVLIANMRGDLQLLDLQTGKINWNYEIGSGIVSNPAVSKGKIWVAASDGFIYCFGK